MSLLKFNIVDSEFNKKELHQIFKLILETNLNLKTIMASIVDLQTKTDAVEASVTALATRVVAIQAALADGGTPEQRQAVADKLDAAKVQLDAIAV